jgi:NitT/TauT family transport system substrate-binding protein
MLPRSWIAALFLLAAGSAGAALEKKQVTIAVGGKTLFYYLPLTLAEQLGYFKEEGLEVEIVDFAGGAKSLQAMIGGSADMVSGSFEHTINMQARGVPVVGIVLQLRYAAIALALPKAKAAAYKSARDLKGLKVGVTAPGSSTNFFVNALLVQDGLKPDDVSIIGVGASSNAVAAMKKGEIDAISNLDPVITKLELDGDVVAVADTRTAEGMKKYYGGDYAASCLYTKKEFIEKYPGTAQAIVNAMVRALRFARESSLEQVLAAIPGDYYAADKQTYKAALKKAIDGYSPDGRFTLEGARNVYKVLKLFEPSVMSANIEVKSTFDNRFVEEAAKRKSK